MDILYRIYSAGSYLSGTLKGKSFLIRTHNIKPLAKIFVIYILIAVVPTLIISGILAEIQMKKYENEYKNKAQRNANLHATNIENFIGETVGRLEMLATLIKVQHSSLIDTEEIFKETQEKDKRFSGFYWANLEGDLLISSNALNSPVNVGDRPYFQQALQSRKTSFSEAHIGRVTGRYIMTIAVPVTENEQIKGVLLASLRLDELENNIKMLLKDEIIVVTDQSGRTVVEASSLTSTKNLADYRIDLKQPPWIITVKLSPENKHLYRHTFFYYLVAVFIIMNVLLLLIYNLRLKFKVKKEKEQNEYQKLELLGNLAASTAHEIRNPLTGINGLIKLLSEEYLDKKAQYYFEVIQKEIIRINAIVSELLVLGKPTAYTLNTYNTIDILREIEPILQSEANYMNVQLSISYSADDVPISCVQDHIKQVILNLSKNALHAMPDGGKLTISIEKDADFCFITIEDTGVGIPKDSLDQVFNPFFSMKKHGSGLGLTICKRIIDTYQGDISIQSTLNKGTLVKIRIPLSK